MCCVRVVRSLMTLKDMSSMQFPRQLFPRLGSRPQAVWWQSTDWEDVEQLVPQGHDGREGYTGRPIWLILPQTQWPAADEMAVEWLAQGIRVFRSVPRGSTPPGQLGPLPLAFVYQMRPVLVVAEAFLSQLPTEGWRYLSGLVVLVGQTRLADQPRGLIHPGLVQSWTMPLLVLLPESAPWRDWPALLAGRVVQGNYDVSLEATHSVLAAQNPVLWALIADWWSLRFFRG